jgi:hypothetical protein
VRAEIRESHRLTVREVSEEVDINEVPCYTILTEELEMHRVGSRSAHTKLIIREFLAKQEMIDLLSRFGPCRFFFCSRG